MTLDDFSPLAVWDTNDSDGLYWAHSPKDISSWALEHIPHANRTVRAEFYMIDGPCAMVWRCVPFDGTTKFADDDGNLLMEKPVMVALDELPPERLMRFP